MLVCMPEDEKDRGRVAVISLVTLKMDKIQRHVYTFISYLYHVCMPTMINKTVL